MRLGRACAGNIWTHLLPLVVLTLALVGGWLPAWPRAPWAFYENILPILLCFGASVAYHTNMAHHVAYRRWLLLDVSPISPPPRESMGACLLCMTPDYMQPLPDAG